MLEGDGECSQKAQTAGEEINKYLYEINKSCPEKKTNCFHRKAFYSRKQNDVNCISDLRTVKKYQWHFRNLK